jgi:hypothetical protein
MNKRLNALLVCLSCMPVAQAVDYQGLSESVDRQKASESVDLEKAREALGN